MWSHVAQVCIYLDDLRSKSIFLAKFKKKPFSIKIRILVALVASQFVEDSGSNPAIGNFH